MLSKDVLSQVDGLVAFKLASRRTATPSKAGLRARPTKASGREFRAQLPTLEKGEALVCLPGHGVFGVEQFPEKLTFDSSRTPKRGEKKRTAELAPIDIDKLKERLATVEAETKANDDRVPGSGVARW